MKQKTCLPLRKTKQGFFSFIKHDYSRLRCSISLFGQKFITSEEDINEYAEALRIEKLYEGFLCTLTDLEENAIRFLRYHNSDELMPKEYWVSLDSAYEKWSRVFADKNINTFAEIDSIRLGKLMKRIRISSMKSSTETAEILSINRATLHKYEQGLRLPQITTLYRFCILFSFSIDTLIENSIKQ
jgi:DNA-binding XRE family transcriptional regulator